MKSKSVVFRIYRGRLTCGSRHVFESFVTAPRACNLFTRTHAAAHSPHTAAAQYADENSLKLKNVILLPLEFNEYAKASLDILGEEARMTPTKLWKYKTVVYGIQYSTKSFCWPFEVFQIYQLSVSTC